MSNLTAAIDALVGPVEVLEQTIAENQQGVWMLRRGEGACRLD